MTIEEFAEKHAIVMTCESVKHNPHMDDKTPMDHWLCELARGSRKGRMQVTFSKGKGHNGEPPTVEEVLDCLASDASGIENADSFEDWAGEYGYDTDSRKAEKIYKACEEETAKLQHFLGEDAYKVLLWETERL